MTTKKLRAPSLALAGIFLLSLGACDDEKDTPTRQDYDDVAASVGSATASNGSNGELASMSDAVDLSFGAMPSGFSIDAAGSIGGSRAGLEYHYTLACSDVDGQAMDVCNGDTDRADLSVDWSGELTIPNYHATVQRSGEWSLQHLQSGTGTLSGNSDFSFETEQRSSSGDVMRHYRFDYSASYDDVRIRLAPRAVIGGSIHYSIDAARHVSGTDGGDVDHTFAIDAVLTFHEDGSATLVLDGTHGYDVNLHTGVATHVDG